jgi:hypothetical protein
LPFNFAGDFFVLLYEHATMAQRIDGAPFGQCHHLTRREFWGCLLRARVRARSPVAAMRRVDSIFHTAQSPKAHLACLLDYGVPVFTDDAASSNYPVFNGPANL